MNKFENQLVILMGGKASRLCPVTYSLPKGLNIINHKPAIFNNIDTLIKYGLKDIIIVCNDSNYDIISSMFRKCYKNLLNIQIVIQHELNGPLGAFQCAEPYINKPTLLMLGDTLCDCNFDYSKNFVGISENKNTNDFQRWCFAITDEDNKILEYEDKPNNKPISNKIVIGVYYFKNANLLKTLLKKDYPELNNEKQLSSLLSVYMKKEEMFAQTITKWQDIGTLENYVNTNSAYLTGRYFNNFKKTDLTIEKQSKEKVVSYEIDWYRQISKTPLKVLIPQFVSYKKGHNDYRYKMELLSGNSLYTYLNYYDIPISNVEYIIKSLFYTANIMWSYSNKKCVMNMPLASRYVFLSKTERRLKEWNNDIINKHEIILNGRKLLGYKEVLNRLSNQIEDLISQSEKYKAVIHGDLNFSNIFYYPDIGKFLFIDPRGKYYKIGIYGDKRYDVAKMRHSFVYKHNKLTHAGFSLQCDANEYKLTYDYDKKEDQLFDKIALMYGFNPTEIKIIDGLLFLSQIPLHKEDHSFQIASFLIGLKILNDSIV